MSTTAGYFTETDLLNIRSRIENYPNWDTNVKKQYVPFADSLKAVIANQTATFTELKDPKKKRTIEVEFIQTCGIAGQSCTGCTMGGNEVSTNTQELEINICQEWPFIIDENKFIGNDFDKEEAIAKAYMAVDKAALEYLNGQVIATIEANLGVNAFTGGKGTVTGTTTYINAANWDAKLMAYFERVRVLNKFSNPYILDGSNLFEQVYGAKLMTDKTDNNFFGTLSYYSDLSGIDAANTPAQKTYLIDRGALAVTTKVFYPTLIEYKDANRFSIPSQLMPGISYDVYYKNSCYGDFYKHEFKVVLNALVAAAPLGCSNTNTGILGFTCGVTP